MLNLTYNKTKTDIKKNNLPQVDLDLQKLLMQTKYPHSDYQFLIRLKCSVKKLIERKEKLTKTGIDNLVKNIDKAIKLSKKVKASVK